MKDGYEPVESCNNKLDEDVNYTYRKVLGAYVIEGSGTTLTNSLSQEPPISQKDHFQLATINFSHQWSTLESKTWSESTEVEVEISEVVVSQLLGNYWPLVVRSSHFQIDYENI
jgi:hypothetical protein